MKDNGAERGHTPPTLSRLAECVVTSVHHWTKDQVFDFKDEYYDQAYRKVFEIELDKVIEAIEKEGKSWAQLKRG